jgi:hypothetical protein
MLDYSYLPHISFLVNFKLNWIFKKYLKLAFKVESRVFRPLMCFTRLSCTLLKIKINKISK